MRHKIPPTIALISFLIIMTATIPLGYAYEWSPDMRLTWNAETDWMPSIAQASDGKIWVIWHSYRTGNADIFYKVYDSSKVHPWSSETRLTTDSNADITPSIMRAKDGKIWVVWSTNRNGNYDIYYKVYDGISWSLDENLTTDPNVDELPSIMQASDGNIWVVWSTNRNGNYDIYYKTYNGTAWSSDKPLTFLAADDWDPSIVQTADGDIWVAWVRNNDIYYMTYNGTKWSPDNALVTDPNFDLHPSIMQASNDNIWVVWDSDRISEQDDIYWKVYDNQTRRWSSDTTLTFDGADDLAPSIMQSVDGTIWIAWASWRLGNLDIYYKTDFPPQHLHDIAIISVIHDPNVSVAYQGLNLYIEVVPQNQGVKDEYVQVKCYANSNLIGSQTIHLSAGQLMPINFKWNTLNVIPGTYTIISNASITGETDTDPADNTFIDGEVHVKIPGDVNGDGVVDAFDLFDLNKAYGSDPSNPNWSPDCDFNRDNKVDASDLFGLSKNYGKTI